jgi:poly-beta-1,6-N-acetyl-D-glucosamine synthase
VGIITVRRETTIATGLFLVCAAAVLYVLFGYPLLLWLAVRRRGNPVHKQPRLKSVTVLLAVRNGEPWIRAKLESILNLDYPKELLQIVVISNGSEDRTEEYVGQYETRGVELVRTAAAGKAAALNAGLERARGEVLFYTDVRQVLAPDSLRHLVSCLADPQVGVASGELVIRDGRTLEEIHTGLYWKYEKSIRKRQSRIDSVIGATGCIFAMRRELAGCMPGDTLLDDVHLPMLAFFRGYRVILEERAKAFDIPSSLHTEFRRKVRTQAGVYQLLRQFPALLGPRNRMLFHFLSHKLGRLLLPHALILMAVSSFFLPEPARRWVLLGQAAFYGLAALDVVMPDCMLRRITSPVRTFVVLMAAALCALAVWIVPARRFWGETRKSGEAGP